MTFRAATEKKSLPPFLNIWGHQLEKDGPIDLKYFLTIWASCYQVSGLPRGRKGGKLFSVAALDIPKPHYY